MQQLSYTLLFLMLAAGGTARAEETYDAKPANGKSLVGQPGVVSLTIEGKNGWHVNEQAPITMTVKPETGVTVDKEKLSRPDLAESTPTRARFDVKCTAAAPGKKTLTAEARFVMCQESACKPEHKTVSLALDVGAAPAAAPAAIPGKKIKKAKKPTAKS